MKHIFHLICLLCLSLGVSAQTMNPVEFKSAAATSSQSGQEASRVIDGNYGSLWHSSYTATPFPVTLTLTLKTKGRVDMLRYIPRCDGNSNGNWKDVDLEYNEAATGSTGWVKIGSYSLEGKASPTDFEIPAGIEAARFRFKIKSGGNNFASAAEIEAWLYDNTKQEAFQQYFSDDLFTELRDGVTSSEGIEDADVKALVDNLLSDADYKRFRVGEYEPYRSVNDLQLELGTSNPYNQWENPTGIYLKQGESCYVAVSGIGEDRVGLNIKNWVENETNTSYSLRNGLNLITAESEGNVFVDYYTLNYKSAPNVRVHFINAPVRGYWDQATMTNDDWKAMLAKLPSDNSVIVVRSQHAQLAYPVSAWKQYCPEDVNTLMTLYQHVQDAEREMMGLEMYGRQCKNRMLFFATKYGFMAASHVGAYCNVNSLKNIMTPDAGKFEFWAVGHEWGHNNQIAHGFKWSGCGETTNNIYASWAQILYSSRSDVYLRLEDETSGVGEYSGMRGGRMQSYFEEGLRKGVAWQLQDGPDYHGEEFQTATVQSVDYDGNKGATVTAQWRHYDHFVKLSPFWQLNLWGTLSGKSPNIIPMVIESIRTTSNYTTTYNTNGKQQINWMKLACDSAKLNLLPFFERAGMLRPINAYIDDYSKGWNKISKKMIDELKAYVEGKGYTTPAEEINYINGHNYHIYRDCLPLSVPANMGTGCSYANGKVKVMHSQVKNAVAFETYNAKGELLRITMYGLGSDDEHSFTQVLYPASDDESEASAYIVAVGYDGTRQRIFDMNNLIQTLSPDHFYNIKSLNRNNSLSVAGSSVNPDGVKTWGLNRAATNTKSVDQLWVLRKGDDGKRYLYNPQADAYYGGSAGSKTTQLYDEASAPAWVAGLVDENNSVYTFEMSGSGQYLNAYSATETGTWGGGSSDNNNLWTVTPVDEYSVSIPTSGFLPVCYPFAFDMPEGLEAYYISEIASEEYEGQNYHYAVLTEMPEGSITARTPVILSGARGSYKLSLRPQDFGEPLESGLLKGTTLKLTPVTKGSTMYNIAATTDAGAGACFSLSSATSVSANKAYLDAVEGASKIYLVQELPTGIDELGADAEKSDTTYYNIDGTRAHRLERGRVYINASGVKVIIL